MTIISSAAAQFTLQCKLYPTPGHSQVTGDDDGTRFRERLKTRSVFFTIDTDQKKFSDGSSVEDLKGLSDKYITIEENKIVSKNNLSEDWKRIDRYTDKYSERTQFLFLGSGRMLWDISVDGDCQKSELRPIPAPKF